MKYPYLVASLPVLSLDTMPPLQLDGFLRQCEGVLDGDDLAEMHNLLGGNTRACASRFARQWHDFEIPFRHHIAEVRAGRTGVNPRTVAPPGQRGDPAVRRGILDAFAKPNPLQREWSLDRARWYVLDELARQDPFGPHAVLAYGLKLRLAHRWAGLNDDQGWRNLDRHLQTVLSHQPAKAP